MKSNDSKNTLTIPEIDLEKIITEIKCKEMYKLLYLDENYKNADCEITQCKNELLETFTKEQKKMYSQIIKNKIIINRVNQMVMFIIGAIERNELLLNHYDRWEDAYRDHFLEINTK